MFDETHPILRNVHEARRHGEVGDYEASLRFYSSARDLTDHEMKSCRSRAEMTKWNALIKDIVAEELHVRRLRTALDDISKEISAAEQKTQDKEIKERQNSRPEFSTHVHSKPIRRGEVQKNPRRRTPSKPRDRPSPEKKPKPSPVAPTPSPKPKLVDNPLMQQIIDSGILIREPDVSWESIAGLADIKRLLRQNLVILPMRPDIAQGLLSPWKSVLFYGPPGTGKTFVAKAIATECHRTFFNITSATITSRFLGESEKLVSYLFDLAEEMAPSTIFFDEIDSLASQRGAANENETSRRMKAQLLTKLEGIDSAGQTDKIFVVAATNFPWDLDEALLRRFQKRVYIPLPDVEARRRLLEMSLEQIIDERFDLDAWAERLEGYSCADITNLCRDAAQMVFERQMKLIDTQQWINMPVDEAQVIVKDDDFAWAVSKRKSSVDLSQIKRYEEWRDQKGAE